jgi:ribosomal protein S18 acetylase RimI-like enzyme
VETREEPLSELRRHASVPSFFETLTVLDVHERADGIELRERRLEKAYRKDYDALEGPMEWPMRFDVSNWGLIGAFDGKKRIGGVVGAFQSPGVDMLEGRGDLLVLWDLRVAPELRRHGVGSALFQALEAWGRSRSCRELKVETQNTNVAACRLYARQGCRLAQAKRHAYPDRPDEVQLIWRKVMP